MSTERVAHVAPADGLRGVSALLVLVFHFYLLSFYVIPIPGLSNRHSLEFIQTNGAIGVELFFLLSAFCLTYPYARMMLGGPPVAPLRHWIYRRAIKIVPSYVLVLFFCSLVVPDLYRSNYEHGKWADLGLHVLFLHNLDPEARDSFNLVLWSMGVEVQFYVVFPLLLLAFRRRPWATGAVMVLTAVVYRGWAQDRPLGETEHYVNMLPGFFDLFACGMIGAYVVAWVRKRQAERPGLADDLVDSLVWTAIGAFALVTVLLIFDWSYDMRFDVPSHIFRSRYRPVLALLFATFLVATTFAVHAWQKILVNRVLIFAGTISYNLYLWHQIVGRLIRDRGWWKADTPTPTDDPHWRWTFFLIATAASILVATLITYVFERPLLRYGVRGCVRRLTALRATLRVRSDDEGDVHVEDRVAAQQQS